MEEASNILARTLEGHLRALERRNLWLLLLNLLVNLLLVVGLVQLFYPQKLSDLLPYRLSLIHLTMVLFGLVGLIFLLNLFAIVQLGSLRRARGHFASELARRDQAERMSLVDPLTGTFDKRYMDEIIPREVARADRQESTLSFVKLGVERLDEAETNLGFQAGERILKEAAQLLKRVFRPTDILIRYGHGEFLVIMPETAKHGALTAVRRLLMKVDEWNKHKIVPGYEMDMSVGVADHTKGKDVRDALVAVDTRVQLYRDKQGPAPAEQ
jgi:diguanylate cyclase (GGDEF)-like protein